MRKVVPDRIIILISLFISITAGAQNTKNQFFKNKLILGVNYGQATQNYFPFHNKNYLYENKYIKGQVNFLLKQKNNFKLEVLIEPGIYNVQYQWLNWYFTQGEIGNEYIRQNYSKNELESFYTKAINTSLLKDYEYSNLRDFREYALNLGLVFRLKITEYFSSYFIASVGPMHSTKHTERLIKGFAFSDIVGCGISYRYKRLIFDTRFTLRHTSNANTKQPNFGHNSAGLEAGLSIAF